MHVEQEPGLRQAVEAVASLPERWTSVAEHTARGLWRLPRAADAVTQALTAAGPAGRDRGWVMVRSRVAEEIASGRDWTREAALWLAAGAADWAESARLTGDLAWRARSEGRSALVFLSGAQVAGNDPCAPYGRALWHCYLTTLRYDFRCGDIEEFFTGVPDDGEGLDPYVAAMRAFALLGRSRASGLPLLETALARGAHDEKVVHALLHGLWLGEDLPGQPERMLELLDAPAFAGGLGAEALLRKASALRRLRRFDEALAAVRSAIDGLGPLEVVVHTDCVRERALILLERDHHRRR
ncbi:hypothetical protein AB0E75_24250 [Streptomyces griseoviridis]|uniref:Uncharacterized protein n=3 Tax=Streptomyces TaxID=1883 RepID=A0ABT9L819_STRGD|nr:MULTISPECIES: hypothetical protein [Streptomyces]MDP9679861.1 hypothetical protein [Streptomyces griseoviridis]GGS63452.1 hypothetical protein GCM10010238_60770 [Streptomyces niveoruber]GGT24562.1 hypothetical protein GCM10010240_66430 [Streptomyces griseoviridis]GGU58577.1 hypothetical protein GCM10010259_56850 [Streptomyces daghestanicus]GHI30136.1 hypothetical protein Sdagh_18660 [Streptomyces daghestanicus]